MLASQQGLHGFLIRRGGPAAFLGGMLTAIGAFLSYSSGAPAWAGGFALLVVGIAGLYLYLRRSARVGLLGTVAFCICVFAFVVLAIISLGHLLNLWGSRWYEALGLVWSPWLILGSALFGVAILRARMLPRGGTWLPILYALTELGAILANVAAVVVFDGSLGWLWLVAAVVFGLGWGWLGYGLWSESRASEGQLSHAS